MGYCLMLYDFMLCAIVLCALFCLMCGCDLFVNRLDDVVRPAWLYYWLCLCVAVV